MAAATATSSTTLSPSASRTSNNVTSGGGLRTLPAPPRADARAWSKLVVDSAGENNHREAPSVRLWRLLDLLGLRALAAFAIAAVVLVAKAD